MAARKFKVGLSMGSELRKSLTKNLIKEMQKLRSSRGWRMIRFKIREKQKKLSTIVRTPKYIDICLLGLGEISSTCHQGRQLK